MFLGHPDQDIFHKNREISILIMKKKPTARLTLLQEATERSKLGKTKTKKKNSSMNKSAQLIAQFLS
jgi:hypothetical protein